MQGNNARTAGSMFCLRMAVDDAGMDAVGVGFGRHGGGLSGKSLAGKLASAACGNAIAEALADAEFGQHEYGMDISIGMENGRYGKLCADSIVCI